MNKAFPNGFTPFPEVGTMLPPALDWEDRYAVRRITHQPKSRLANPYVREIIQRATKHSWRDKAGEEYWATRAQIIGRARNDAIVRVRQAVYLLAYKLTRASSPEIGRAVGDRDHTTVLNGIRRAKLRMAHELAFRATVEKIAEELA